MTMIKAIDRALYRSLLADDFYCNNRSFQNPLLARQRCSRRHYPHRKTNTDSTAAAGTDNTMTQKPIFVATHPRACSTAFERVFMTRGDALKCVHEPFGDAFYFGPERLSERYENDERARVASGFGDSTYKSIFDSIEKENGEGKRLFIKDIIHYLVPPSGKPASVAPSLSHKKKGVGTSFFEHKADQGRSGESHAKAPYPYNTKAEPGNPTVVPAEFLKRFHFTFLIRHPSKSIPSYWRCTIPPLDDVTGFHDFMPSEAGYDEVRRVFDYLRRIGQVGPNVAYQGNNGVVSNGKNTSSKPGVDICVIDADDLLDYPAQVIEKYCKCVGLDYKPEMLVWDDEASHQQARDAFEKWKGFHEDAINSSSLRPRKQKHVVKSIDDEFAGWTAKYGSEAAKTIRKTVEANLDDYNYMKQFAIKVDEP